MRGRRLVVPSPLVGEGQGGGCAPHSAVRSIAYDSHDALEFGKRIVIRETQHEITLRHEPGISFLIMPLTRLEIVAFAIKLDDQPCRMTNEISNVATHRNLTPE
jgi:hypothetical protein